MVERLATFHEFFQSNQNKRLLAVYGGAGSGKSVATAQHIVYLLLTHPNARILVIRKTLPALRITAYRLILDILYQMQVPFYLNKSELVIRFNNSEILFKGLDDPEKIKSYEANYVWCEEATEITREDFLQLNLRMRRANSLTNQIFLTFNPIDQYHWLITDIVQGNRDDVAIHHSTYKDNIRFLSPEYISELENLINQDQNYYRIYALGEPGVLENVIYTNYEITDTWPKGGDLFYGLDFGFNNPTSLVEVCVYDSLVYVRERIYRSGLTNADVTNELKTLVKHKTSPIYADSAEPARIQEIRNAGFNVHPADKSVLDGIDAVKRKRLHIHQDSQNLIGEIRGYSYRTDKNGRVLEEPVKFRDHAMDALRYAIHTHTLKGNRGGFHIGGANRTW